MTSAYRRSRPSRPLLVLIALTAMLFTSCGYHTAGKAVRIPVSVQTISVPIFVNQTQTYRIEQTMTAAVVREFLSRTKYRVLNEENSTADATLHGTIVTTQLAPLTYDSQTGRASSALVTVNLKIVLTDKNGKVLYDNPNYVFREQYQVSREVSSFFEEESPAVERLSRDMARTLVADILENY
ncbi:MAG TPA: LPS assembly lipoprotein LptE [Terriglobales bacterium]|nr:LPS assembly lipoprotein LptE [Terriglobales bacterium]